MSTWFELLDRYEKAAIAYGAAERGKQLAPSPANIKALSYMHDRLTEAREALIEQTDLIPS